MRTVNAHSRPKGPSDPRKGNGVGGRMKQP